PILKTLARKQMDKPTAMVSRGATLMPISAQPCASFRGSRKNTWRLATGSLPTARNITAPRTAVSMTANSGEHHAISVEGRARRSRASMAALPFPQAAHPAPHEVHRRFARRDGRRNAALGHDDQAIG